MKNNDYDQFYTNPKVAEKIINLLKDFFQLEDFTFIEPSAGTGNFIDALYQAGIDVNKKCIAYDIDPKSNSLIKKLDFLKLDITKLKNNKKKQMVIGNPPFGKKANLAIDFLNKSLEISDIVCMILPKTFNRYSIQSKVKSDAKLIYSIDLPSESFIVNDRSYSVNCVFQIWTNSNFKTWFPNIRLKKSNLKIDKLELFIHNNTKNTLKFFDKNKYKWNFGIVRQGYYDYNEKIYDENKLIKNRQYLFVKTDDPYLVEIINEIDFEKLSKSNTSVLGFSNSDLISEIYKKHLYRIMI